MASFGAFGGGAVGGAVVKLLLDDSQFQAGLSKDEAQMRGASASMGRSSQKFSATAKAGFAIAGAAALKFAGDSLEAFMESETAMAQFQSTLKLMPKLAGETTGAFEDQAAALQDLTGFQDEAIIGADTILARFNLTGDQIRAAIPIVLDYARAMNIDVPTAAQNVGKALLGNTRALKSVGIEFTATGDRGKDFASILDLLNGKVGGAAEAFGETLAGKMDRAKAKLDELKEGIGEFLGGGLLLLTGDVEGAAQAFSSLVSVTTDATQVMDFATAGWSLGAGAVENLTAAQVAARTALQHTTSAANEEAAGHQNAAAAMRAQAQAAENLRNTENALAGGLLGVLAAGQQVAESQAVIARLQEKGRTGTQAYNEAVRQGISDYLGLRSAVAEYNSTAGNTAHSNELVKATLANVAQQMGLGKGAANALMASFNSLQGGVAGANSELDRTAALINAIPTHKDVSIVVHYSQVGTPGTAGGTQ